MRYFKPKKVLFMKNIFVLSLLLTMLASCSTTKVANTWKDASQADLKVTKALVIFVTDHAPVQEAFENAFVAKLQANNIEAFASYKVLLTDKKVDKNFILKKVTSLGIDAVIVTRILGAKEKIVSDRPSPYKIPYAQYSIKLHEANMKRYGKDKPSGYIAKFDQVALKTTVHAVSTQQPIWYLESNTIVQETFNKLLDSYLNVVISGLKNEQLI